MIDLGDGKKPPVFTFDQRELNKARARGMMSRTEWRLLLFLPVLVGVLVWTIYDWRDKLSSGPVELIPTMLVLQPMAKPSAAALPEMPNETDLSIARPDAAARVQAGNPPALTADGFDASTVTWAIERVAADRLTPPLPTRLAARDLVFPDHARVGTPLIIEGRLDDRLPAVIPGEERDWQRLVIALEEGQYAVVLAVPESATLVQGHDVRVTGRLLGTIAVPVTPEAKAGAPPPAPVRQVMPLVLGRVVVESVKEQSPDDALAEFHRPWTMPDGIWDEVDDTRLWTETRPYYYLLGQLLRDRTTPGIFDDAPDGNWMADDLHLDPPKFRGKPYKVTGYVYQAWEDPDVARDQPFGVGRVVRVLLWRRDAAPYTESVNGVRKREVKMPLRLYEFAAVTDQPLPEHGVQLVATGRFLKQRAILVNPDRVRDQINGIERQSDRVYPFLFVTGAWIEMPNVAKYEGSMGPLAWTISAVCLVALLIGIWWWLHEVRGGQRRLDVRRRALIAGKAAAAAAAAAATDAPAPPAAAPADPSPPSPGGQAPPAP